MVLYNLVDGGLSHKGPLLGPYKSMSGGTPGANPYQQPPNAWQVSTCLMIWIFLVRDEFVEYSILGTKYFGMKSLSAFSPS
jgi:hypothetical protein